MFFQLDVRKVALENAGGNRFVVDETEFPPTQRKREVKQTGIKEDFTFDRVRVLMLENTSRLEVY